MILDEDLNVKIIGGVYWTSLLLSVYAINIPNWIQHKTGYASYGLFKACFGEKCGYWDVQGKQYTSIISSRGLISTALVLGILGWISLCLSLYTTSRHCSKLIVLIFSFSTPILFLASGMLYCVGMEVWTSYFCYYEAVCLSYTYEFNYYVIYIASCLIFTAVLPACIVALNMWNEQRNHRLWQ